MSQQRPAQIRAAGRRPKSPKVLHFSAPRTQGLAIGSELMMRMNINVTHMVYQMLRREHFTTLTQPSRRPSGAGKVGIPVSQNRKSRHRQVGPLAKETRLRSG